MLCTIRSEVTNCLATSRLQTHLFDLQCFKNEETAQQIWMVQLSRRTGGSGHRGLVSPLGHDQLELSGGWSSQTKHMLSTLPLSPHTHPPIVSQAMPASVLCLSLPCRQMRTQQMSWVLPGEWERQESTKGLQTSVTDMC